MTIAGELQKTVESLGQKTFKNISNHMNLHHHMKIKNQEKKMLSPKNKHIQLSDSTGTSNGTGFCGQMRLNNSLFSSKHSRLVW